MFFVSKGNLFYVYFSTILYKGDDFCNFLFPFHQVPSEKEYTKSQEFAPNGGLVGVVGGGGGQILFFLRKPLFE